MSLTVTPALPIRTYQAASAPAPASRPADPTDVNAVSFGKGPIPDYAPLAGMVAHVGLRGLCQPFVNVLSNAFGNTLTLSSVGYNGPGTMGSSEFSDQNLAWMRDFHPTYVKTQDGHTRVVTFAAENPNRHYYNISTYAPIQPPAPGMQLYRPPGQSLGGQWLETQQVPLLHEDGNLVPTGEYSFVTDKLFRDNAVEHFDNRALRQAGYRARSEAEVRDMFCKAMDIDPEKLIVMPQMPGEKTGHQDMYLLAVGPKHVMIPRIPEEAIHQLTYGHEIDMGHTVQHFLDEQSAHLESMGFKVDRLSMMAPTFLTPDSRSSTGYFGHFDSPANSLLVNVGDRHEVDLPTVNLDGFPDAYKAVSSRYQQEWVDYFKGQGYEGKLLDATELFKGNGLFRCVTFPIPVVSK